jgi:SAM-dependent methyltransferase
MKAMQLDSIVTRFSHVYRTHGVRGVAVALYRRAVSPTARSFRVIRQRVQGASGLEVGGPSAVFDEKSLLPVYPIAGRIDNCNFAANTLWENDASDGSAFHFSAHRPPGRKYVAEATDLGAIPTSSYDFVLSSHTLEHTANPLKALAEWRRVLKSGGTLVLVVPHKDGTFDHRRPVTSLAHLKEDFLADRGEDDLTHLEEVLVLHDLARDPWSTSFSLRERMRLNHEHRSMHHHVFDTRLVVDACEAAGFDLLAVEPIWHDHIIVVADRGDAGLHPWTRFGGSPFPSDW